MNNNHERHLTWSFVRFRIHVILTTNVLINRTVTWYTVEARSYSLMAVPPLSVPSRWFLCDGPLVVIPLLRFLCGGFFEAASPCCDTLAVAPWRWPPCGVASLQFPRVVYRNAWGEEPHCFYRTAHCLKFKLLRRGFYDSCQAIAFHSVAIFLCLCCWYYAIRSVQKIDEFLFFSFYFFAFHHCIRKCTHIFGITVFGCSSLSRWVLSNFIVISEDYPGLFDIFMGIYFSEIFLKIERLL